MDARDNGHPVMEGLIEGGLEYIERWINNEGAGDSYVLPYAHYMLAVGERGKASAIRDQLKRSYGPEDTYLLMAALYLSGDRTYEEQLRKPKVQITTTRSWRTFRTTLRSKGMILSIHQKLFGVRDPDGEELAQSIASTLREQQSYRYSTQELVWGTYSLARRAQTPKDWKAPQLKLGNKVLAPESESQEGGSSWSVWDIARQELELTAEAQGSDSYLIISTEGVKKEGSYTYGSRGVSVKRELLKPDGTPLATNKGALSNTLGDMIYVRLTVSNLQQVKQHELALVDHLPAGWEPERIDPNDPQLSSFYNKEVWSKEHFNIRDQRIEVFGDLAAGQTAQFVYVVRAVTAGQFFVPPVELEAMYNSDIGARESGTLLKVAGPWDGSLL